MRIPIIAANWKMNTTLPEAVRLVTELRAGGLEGIPGVEKVLCPPFVSLAALAELLQGSEVKLGAQNMYFQEKGAYTGEISPVMLADLCQYVILGHSERRSYFGEDDALVNRKVKAALKAGLKPILCVGERLEEREAGRTEALVVKQVRGALADIGSAPGLVVAYEPVWAIGTGRAATPADAMAVIRLIRATLAELLGAKAAEETRIQYGGSVTPENIVGFVQEPEVDGALVGGASLKARDFLHIVHQTSAIKSGSV